MGMAVHSCANCGSELSDGDKYCPKCGAANMHYVPTESHLTGPASSDTGLYSSASKTNPPMKRLNVFVLIVLLICFWPAAIIYAIVMSVKE